MQVNAGLPQQSAGVRIHGINGRPSITKIGGVFSPADRRHSDRGPYLAFGAERPIGAAGAGVQRVDSAVGAAEVEAAAYGGDLRGDADRIGKSECPLDLKLGNILSTEPGGSGRLKAAVRRIDAPSVPPVEIGERGSPGGATTVTRGSGGRRGTRRKKIRDRLAFGGGELCPFALHGAGFQGHDDGRIRPLAKRLGERRTTIRPSRAVTHRTIHLKQRLAVRRRGGGLSGSYDHRAQNQPDDSEHGDHYPRTARAGPRMPPRRHRQRGPGGAGASRRIPAVERTNRARSSPAVASHRSGSAWSAPVDRARARRRRNRLPLNLRMGKDRCSLGSDRRLSERTAIRAGGSQDATRADALR